MRRNEAYSNSTRAHSLAVHSHGGGSRENRHQIRELLIELEGRCLPEATGTSTELEDTASSPSTA